jgi:acyl-coenzyme A thioesterase PaaI-like protein
MVCGGVIGDSLRSRLTRWGFDLFPAYRGTGACSSCLADDWREVRVKLLLTWRTRNAVGTVYGGSMNGAVDPVYMIMLMRILSREYVVWDKAATVQFRRPGRSTLYACFRLDERETESIIAELNERPVPERVYQVDLTDADGEVHASVTKTLRIQPPGALGIAPGGGWLIPATRGTPIATVRRNDGRATCFSAEHRPLAPRAALRSGQLAPHAVGLLAQQQRQVRVLPRHHGHRCRALRDGTQPELSVAIPAPAQYLTGAGQAAGVLSACC